MHYKADTVDEYIEQLPEERKVVVLKIREMAKRTLEKCGREIMVAEKWWKRNVLEK